MEIPIPQLNPKNKMEFFRLLLLSPRDISNPSTIARIERTYNSTGGRYVGIIFQLHEKSPSGNGTVAFMKLQERHVDPDLVRYPSS